MSTPDIKKSIVQYDVSYKRHSAAAASNPLASTPPPPHAFPLPG
jgi:hypothetical protein